MKIGIIAPIEFLEKYCITNTQYCLPSLLIGNKKYRDFYNKRKQKGDTIILDCKKVSWKRQPEDFEIVEKALKALDPDIIIAPSYMFNIQASSKTLERFMNKFSKASHRIVKCLEGTSEEDLSYFPWTEKLAVPSHMYRFLSIIDSSSSTIYIENHLTLEELRGRKGILVTSLPIRLGLQGRLLFDVRPTPESLTFYEEEDSYPMITKKNVENTIEYYDEV